MNNNMTSNIREEFPILSLHKEKLIYFDNAATSQKPRNVIEAMNKFYSTDNANIHRGVYDLAKRATIIYEKIRNKIRDFINAEESSEIIFVKGATEAINLVAQSYGSKYLKAGDDVIISRMEHHSNIVPWQCICEKFGANLRIINITAQGELDLDHYESLLNERTKLVAITHVSNVLGTINPVKKIIAKAHNYNIPVLIDGAQAIGHMQVDVQDLACDFYVFSAHKMYGPTGIGVLYGKRELLHLMPPYQTGGGMIEKVTFTKTTYADLPNKFEAGTQNIAGVIGLGAAIDFLSSIGFAYLFQHEQMLLQYANDLLHKNKFIKIIGEVAKKIGVISFVLPNIHSHDVATIFSDTQIAVRAGHHCCMPLMDFYGISGTTRISFGIYNTIQEIDELLLAFAKVKKIFKVY
jgi:cysteine desulfurase/selenocysteine lyase